MRVWWRDRVNHKSRRAPIGRRSSGSGRARRFPVPRPTRRGPMRFRPTNCPTPYMDLLSRAPRPGFSRCENARVDFSRATPKPTAANSSIGPLVAQQESAAGPTRPIEIQQRRISVAEMQIAVRARRKAENWGHCCHCRARPGNPSFKDSVTIGDGCAGQARA